MLTPITAVGGVNSKIVCRNKDVFYLKENIIVHDSIPDLVRTVVVGPSHQPCSVTSFDVVGNSLAVAYRTLTGPHVELHQLSASHSTLGAPSQITGISGIEICDVAFSDDGRRLAVLTSLPDFSVMVFDTASKQRVHCLNLVIPANRIAFSAVSDSQVLVHGSGIAQIVDFAAAPPSVLRCEYVDGNTPLTAHSACFDDAGRVMVATKAGFAVCFDPHSLRSNANSVASASGFVCAMVSGQGSSAFISSYRGAIVCAGEDNSLRVFDLGTEQRLPHLLFATEIAVASGAALCGGCCSSDLIVLLDTAGNVYAVDILALPSKPFEAATDGQADVPAASRIASWKATGLAPRTPAFPPEHHAFVATGVLQCNDVYSVTLVESGHSARITAAAPLYLLSGEPSSTVVCVSDDCSARAWSNASAAAAPISVFRERSSPSAFTCCVACPALPGQVVVADATGRVSVLGMADDGSSLVRIHATRVAHAPITALAVGLCDGSVVVAAASGFNLILVKLSKPAESFQLISSVSMGGRSVAAVALHGKHVYAAVCSGAAAQDELVIFKLPAAAQPLVSAESLSPIVKPLPGAPTSLLVKDHASDMSRSTVTVSCSRDIICMDVYFAGSNFQPAQETENAEGQAAAADEGAATTLYTHQRRRVASAPLQYSVYGNSMLSACDDGFVVVHKDSQAHAVAVANAFDGGCTAVAAAGKYVYAGTARGCLVSFSSPLLPPSSSPPPAVTPPPNSIVISDKSIVEEGIEACNMLQSKSTDAARGETLVKVAVIKEKLQALLSDNVSAPPDERLSRFDFVIDSAMQSQLDADSVKRVRAAQEEIKMQNLTADLLRDRLMDGTWGTLNEQALVLSALSKPLQVSTFPVCKPHSEFEKQSSLVSYYRSVELAEFALLRSANVQVSNVHSELQSAFPGSVWCDERPKHSILDLKSLNTAPLPSASRAPDMTSTSSPAASPSPLNQTGSSYLGDDDELVDDPRAKKISWGAKQLLYPRFDVTTRERRITQAVLLLEEAMSRRAAFNVAWKEFQAKKRSAVAKVDERNGRISEIIEEIKSSDEIVQINDSSGEDASAKLQVKDSELSSEIVKAGDDGKNADAGERNKDGKIDEASERALQDMMGGKLEGGRDVKLLERFIEAPAWYVEGMTEMSDERAKELKEWQAQHKALELEKEKYRKTLDTELKKLKSEAASIIDAFDESIGALADLRMGHNSAAFELELLAERCAVLVHAEESAIAAIESTQLVLPELQTTHAKLVELCHTHDAVAAEDERAANLLAAEEKAMERKLRKELNDQAPIVAEPLLSILKQVGASLTAQPAGSVPMPNLNPDAPPNHVDAGIWQWFFSEVSARQKVWNRWLLAHGIARTSALQAAEFHDRLHVAMQELELAQQRLQRLQLQLQLLAVDLDVVLILKQGQIEVEESPVVTDMSDAVLVSKPTIQSQNERIVHQGGVMVSLLRDTMKLQSGIQRFRWDAEELEMREEDVTSRIRHFQLLRVTKDLQLRISGAETKSNLDNVASLEKQIGNLHEVHQAKVAVVKKKLEKLDTSSRGFLRENSELEEDILALESSMAERDRLADLQGTASLNVRDEMSKLQSKRLSTHRRLLDLAKAQTREIELMREELVRLRAKTFPSFAQLRDSFMLD